MKEKSNSGTASYQPPEGSEYNHRYCRCFSFTASCPPLRRLHSLSTTATPLPLHRFLFAAATFPLLVRRCRSYFTCLLLRRPSLNTRRSLNPRLYPKYNETTKVILEWQELKKLLGNRDYPAISTRILDVGHLLLVRVAMAMFK